MSHARLSLAVVLLALCAAPAQAQKEFGFDNRKSSGQPYLKPEESVERMKAADGFEVKLFAAEPMVVNPIAMTVDEKGRVWVIECFEYPKRTAKGKMPRDRIVILEDTDGDGVADKRTVFAEGKDFPGTVRPGHRPRGRQRRRLRRRPALPVLHREQGRQAGQVRDPAQGLRQPGHARDAEHLPVGAGRPALRLAGRLHALGSEAGAGRRPDDAPQRRRLALRHAGRRSSRSSPRGRATRGAWTTATPTGSSSCAAASSRTCSTSVPGGTYKRQAGQSVQPLRLRRNQGDLRPHLPQGERLGARRPDLARHAADAGGVPRQRDLRQHPRLLDQAQRPEEERLDLHREPGRRLPRQSGDKNFRPINLRWGPQRRDLLHRLARPEPVLTRPTRTAGTTNTAGSFAFRRRG